MTPTLRSPARSADSGIACSPSSKFVSMLSNIFDISALNYDIIRNFQCNLAASLSFGRQTTILFSFMLICFLCAYYTKHLAFRPLQTPQLTGVVIHRPDAITPRRAVFQQDRQHLFWNVPFPYIALEGTICRFASHSSFAFWAIVYQKNNPQTISQWLALSLKCHHLPPLEVLRGAECLPASGGGKARSAIASSMAARSRISSIWSSSTVGKSRWYFTAKRLRSCSLRVYRMTASSLSEPRTIPIGGLSPGFIISRS